MFLPLQQIAALYIKVRKTNLIIRKEAGENSLCRTCMNNTKWALERIV